MIRDNIHFIKCVFQGGGLSVSAVDSMEGGHIETNEELLKDPPNNLDTAIQLNRTLQRRIFQTIQRLNQVCFMLTLPFMVSFINFDVSITLNLRYVK